MDGGDIIKRLRREMYEYSDRTGRLPEAHYVTLEERSAVLEVMTEAARLSGRCWDYWVDQEGQVLLYSLPLKVK